jgi:HEAT repeat protein
MRPLPLVAILLVLLPCGSSASVEDARPAPPNWSERAPDDWFEMLKTADASTRRAAVRSLQRSDGGRFAQTLREPLLHAMAHDPDPYVRVLAARAVGQHNADLNADEELKAVAPFLAGVLQGKDAELQKEVLYAIQAIGPHAEAALPALRTRLREGPKDERYAGVVALAAIGGPALNDLAQLFTQDELDLSGDAFQAFEHLRERGRPALPLLTRLAGSDNHRVSLFASAAAGAVQPNALENTPDAEENVRRCIRSLRDPENAADGGIGLRALAAYGGKGAAAVPAVIEWYLRITREAKGTNEEEQANGAGLSVAGTILNMREAAFGPLVAVMTNGDVDARAIAAVLLGNFTQTNVPLPDVALPPLLKMLDDPDPRLHLSAAEVIRHYGPRARATVPGLLRLFVTEKNRGRQGVVAEALNKIDAEALRGAPQAEALVPALIVELGGANQPADEAAHLLALIGPKAARAVPAMLHASLAGGDNDDGRGMRFRIAEMGPPAVPELVKALADGDAGIRRAAAATLFHMAREPAAEGALAALDRTSVNDADPDVRGEAQIAANNIRQALRGRRSPRRPPVG